MGYPLPPKPWSNEFAYFLVALPADREFVRAAKGAFTDMANVWKWGEEGISQDSYDARQAWLDAISETWRLLEMGWPDLMLQYTDEIEGLLRTLRDLSCCGAPSADMFYPDGVTIAPTDELVDQTGGDIVRDTGTPPGGIGTWAAYDEALCAEATAFVDDTLPTILNICEQFFDVVQTLAYPVVIAAAAAILAAMGIAVPAVFLSVSQLGAAIELIRQLMTNEDTVFDTYASEIATQRQALICSIVQEDTAEDAEAAFRLELAAASPKGYDWIRSTAPLGYLVRRMFNADTDANNSGGFGGPGGDCDCVDPADHTYTWSGAELDTQWDGGSYQGWSCTGALGLNPNQIDATIRAVGTNLAAITTAIPAVVGTLDDYRVRLIVTYRTEADYAGNIFVDITNDDGTVYTEQLPDAPGQVHVATVTGDNKGLWDNNQARSLQVRTTSDGSANSATNIICVQSIQLDLIAL